MSIAELHETRRMRRTIENVPVGGPTAAGSDVHDVTTMRKQPVTLLPGWPLIQELKSERLLVDWDMKASAAAR